MSNTSSPQLDHPNVRVPPPLIYVAGLVLGLVLERTFPAVVLPRTVSQAAALVCLALWIGLTVWSVGSFRRNRTSLIPIKPATALVISGPYRFTRNPMYVGMICLYLALSLWFNIFWALILLPIVIGVVRYYVIAREERYLESKFGDEYVQYRARVRRWI